MKLPRHAIQLSITAIIFAVAVWLLVRELQKHSFDEVMASLRDIPIANLWCAVGLTVLNYLILILYEYQAVRAIGHPLEIKRIALGSFIGSAVSLNFGALLGGTPIRIRLYASWGLTAIEIAKLMAMLAITFWVGALALAGIVFTVDPFPVPLDLQERIHIQNVRPLGYVLLVIVAIYVSVSLVRKAPIVFRNHEFTIPSLRLTLSQLVIASLDQMVAAGVAFALMQGAIDITFAEFLGIYLLAVTAVLITHVPGGAGILELIFIKLVVTDPPARGVAALLVFRLMYYVAPLLIAAILFAINEMVRLMRHREKPVEVLKKSV